MNSPVCKCCGHPLPPAGVFTVLSPHQQRLFRILQRAGAGGLETSEIINQLYANDVNGGPDSRNIICVMVERMQNLVNAFGVCIVATGGPGSRYYLVPLDQKAKYYKRSERNYRRLRAKESNEQTQKRKPATAKQRASSSRGLAQTPQT